MGKRTTRHPGEWPVFRDRFLRDVVTGFARRRKALRCSGCEVILPEPDDVDEWFEISTDAGPRVIVLTLEQRHRGHLLVQRRSTGLTLIRHEHMRLVNAPARIVAAFEASTSVAHFEATTGAFAASLSAAWAPLCLEII